MSTVNPTMLLRDETVLPTNEVIKKVHAEELFGVYFRADNFIHL